ncbi:MAG TPA: hypothetical protein VHZ25_10665 [Acidobacteriaceae bacterium]|jgi:predicted RNA polymerase sigma factor|nr:hypothetical protein [Acidobacteriaceae bacterium]
MPQYLVTIQLPDNYDPSLEDEATIRDIYTLSEEMEAAGVTKFACGLSPAGNAKAQIERGMAALEQAQKLGGGAGNYALQAAIAACHMRARSAGETDWDRIVLLYDALMQISPSPIVALNRAVAVGMAHGPAAGLEALDAAAAHSALAGYHLLPSVRGDLLMKMGRFAEARQEMQRAIAMTENLREQELLTEKLKHLKNQTTPPSPRNP